MRKTKYTTINSLSEELLEEFKDKFVSRMSIQELSRHFNICEGSVYKLGRMFNLKEMRVRAFDPTPPLEWDD